MIKSSLDTQNISTYLVVKGWSGKRDKGVGQENLTGPGRIAKMKINNL